MDRLGVLDNTLFVVTSDHGAPMVFTDDGDVAIHRPNGPWRGQKGDLWEGGHRVLFVARWPEGLPAGTVADGPMCLTDLLPTIAAAAGISVPDGAAEDGRSVLAMLSGQPPSDSERAIVHHSLGGRFAVREGRWVALFADGSGGGFSEPSITELFASGSGKAHPAPPWNAAHPKGQLYEITADPEQTHNLWDDRPEVVARLYARAMTIAGDPTSGLPFDVPVSG